MSPFWKFKKKTGAAPADARKVAEAVRILRGSVTLSVDGTLKEQNATLKRARRAYGKSPTKAMAVAITQADAILQLYGKGKLSAHGAASNLMGPVKKMKLLMGERTD